MLSQIFTSILLMSAVGSVLILVLILLKPVTKKVFGSHWQYYIWLAALIVMVLPVRIQLPDEIAETPQEEFDGQHISDIQDNYTYIAEQEPSGNSNTQKAQTGTVQGKVSAAMKNVHVGRYDLFIYIWIVGTALFLMTGLIKYGLFIKIISRDSVGISCPEMIKALKEKRMKNTVRVYVTDYIDAPMMVGVFRPSMWLPNHVLSEKEFRYILMHELTHLKRRDLWYKWFALIVSSIHWFNPLVHLAVRQINEECEISCDLVVTDHMNREEKNGYMNTILSFISANNVKEQIFTTAMANDKNQIIRRFGMIRTATKKSKIIIAASITAAIIILAAALLSSGILNAQNTDYVKEPAGGKTNILLTGEVMGQRRADTIMLFSLDNTDKSVSILTIPSYTKIRDTGNIESRIDSISALEGEEAVIDAVQNHLKIPVDYYVKLSTEDLRNIIDMLGGVEYEVPLKMEYEDTYQNLHISLEKGMQVLTGDKAEQLLRFRKGSSGSYPGGHLDRDITQQSFMVELIRQKAGSGGISRIIQMSGEILKNVETNFPASKIPEYINLWKDADFNDIKTFSLPGEIVHDNINYFIVDYEGLSKLTEQYFK